MSWKKLSKHKVPRWVIKKRRDHVRGRTYLYRKRSNEWQRKLKSEWEDKNPWWVYMLITILAAVVAGVILNYFF